MSQTADLHTALSLLDQALDKTEGDFNLTTDELRAVRVKRAEAVLAQATKVYNEVTGRRTR